jgi:hypothetical protein
MSRGGLAMSRPRLSPFNVKRGGVLQLFRGPGRDMSCETHLLFNDTKLQNPWSVAVGSSISGRVAVDRAVMFPSHCACNR